jgi:DNA-binding NtrC family response regulator
MAGTQKQSILYAENDPKILASQAQSLEKAGYSVSKIIGRAAAEQALKEGKFDLMVLGHTLSKDDRHHLPYKARKANEDMRILVLHASGHHHEVDLAMDSRDGMEAVLRAIASLLEKKAAVAAAK